MKTSQHLCSLYWDKAICWYLFSHSKIEQVTKRFSIYDFSILLGFLGYWGDLQPGHSNYPPFSVYHLSLHVLHITAISHSEQIKWSCAKFWQITQQLEMNESSPFSTAFAFDKSFLIISSLFYEISFTFLLNSAKFSGKNLYGFPKSSF